MSVRGAIGGAIPLTWNTADAAFLLGVHPMTVRRRIAEGALPGAYPERWYRNTGPGGVILRRVSWRIPDAALRAYQARKAAETDAKRRAAPTPPSGSVAPGYRRQYRRQERERQQRAQGG